VARHERGFGRLPIVYDAWRIRLLHETIVELDELCRLTQDGPRLFIDLKGTDRRLPAAIVETLRRNDAVDRAAVCGQFWPPLDAMGRDEPRLKIFHSMARPEHVLAYAPRLAAEGRLDGVSVGHWLVTPELVQTYAERGLQVFVWTVNEPELASRFVEAGAHGIISDRLDLLAGLP
jgi:glycerophosphoryl diester phosphodiesterase